MKRLTLAVQLLLLVGAIACGGPTVDDRSGMTREDSEALSSGQACEEACRRRSAFADAVDCLGKSHCPLVEDGKGHYGPICGELAEEILPVCGNPALSSGCDSAMNRLDTCVSVYRTALKDLAGRAFGSQIGGLCYGGVAANNLARHAGACSAYSGDAQAKELWGLIQGYFDPGQTASCWKPCP